ncbi:uncharacterized protein DNG_07171 [Cephalotrichum gorgonifer]|uniref:Protein ECM13 n=1 Tax=Cephalotrichum gorgonifer TaxID=2041049 RepID=A0AAE8SX55_9PEZI|nr:uncharacterized protein DNG_07171 [Cephalotrichum gorgonifer]
MVSSVTFASPLHPSRPAPASPGYTPFSLKKKTMSITQTYFLAHKARAKLAKEASRSDHDLRLLVGHANLLDGLMLELADAEREQESWFNNSVKGASRTEVEEQHVEYEDTIIEVSDDDDEGWSSSSDESDSEDEEEEEDVEMADAVSMRRVSVPALRIEDEDMEDDDDDEDFAQLELVRTPSRGSPPELDDDEDTSEDESMPPSPPTTALPFSVKETQEEELQRKEASFFQDDLFVPPRNPARLMTPAISTR